MSLGTLAVDGVEQISNNSATPEALSLSLSRVYAEAISPQSLISSAGKVDVAISNVAMLATDVDATALLRGKLKFVHPGPGATAKRSRVLAATTPHLCNFCAEIVVENHDITAASTSSMGITITDPANAGNYLDVRVNRITNQLFISGVGTFAFADVITAITVGSAYKLAFAVVNDNILAFLDSGSGYYLVSRKALAANALSNKQLQIGLLSYCNAASITITKLSYGSTGVTGLADPTFVRYEDGALFLEDDGSKLLTFTCRFYSPDALWADQVKYSHGVLARMGKDGGISVVSHLYFRRPGGRICGDSPATFVVSRSTGKWTVVTSGFGTVTPPLAWYSSDAVDPRISPNTVIDVTQLTLPGGARGAWDFAIIRRSGRLYMVYTTTVDGVAMRIIRVSGESMEALTLDAEYNPAYTMEGVKLVNLGGQWYWSIGKTALTFEIVSFDLTQVLATIAITSLPSNAAITHPALFTTNTGAGSIVQMISFGGTSFAGSDQVGYGVPLLYSSPIFPGNQLPDA